MRPGRPFIATMVARCSPPAPALLTLLTVLSPDPVLADTTFAAERVLFRNNQPGKPLLADLDGDDDLDVILSGSAGVFTLENTDGNGTLGPQVHVGPGRADHVADIDGDGAPDLVTSYSPSSTSPSRNLAWHRNLGGATHFSAVNLVKTGERSTTLLPPIDLDGDDDLDFLWLDGLNDQLEWSENSDGSGTAFAAPVELLGSLTLLNPAFGDIDGDDIPDFIGQDWKGTGNASDDDIVIFPGLPTTPLSFGAASPLVSGATLSGVADINGDTHLDLIVPGASFEDRDWRPNDGSGSFGPARALISGASDSPENLTIADLDDDDDPDVVFSESYGDIHWVENSDGTGTFGSPVLVGSPAENAGQLVVGDLTGEGDPEVIASDELALLQFTNVNGASSFDPPIPLVEAIDWINDIDAADLAGGAGEDPADLVFATSDGKLFRIPNLGDGAFGGAVEIADGLGEVDEIGLAGIDDTGGIDLFTLATNEGWVRWHSGSPPGGFDPAAPIDSAASPRSLAWDDLDGNGSLDLAVALRSDGEVAIYHQDPATHAFNKSTLPGTLADVEAVALGEIDGNPGVDIVAVTPFPDNRIYLAANDGSGSFSSPVEVGTMPGSVDQVEVADLDGDTDLDILAMESDGARSNILWFQNDGSGGFGAGILVHDVSAGVREIAIGDLDNDDDLDFVSVNSNSELTLWHENDGSGLFPVSGNGFQRDPSSSPYDVLLRDLDGDGDLDVVTTTRFGGLVGWYENQFGETALVKWAKTFGLRDAALDPGADDDKDGLPLYEEFAYNMDPTVADHAVVALDGEAGLPNQYFFFTASGGVRPRGTFIRRRDHAEVGLTYTIERSPDLEEWFPLSPGGAFTINDDYQRVTYNRLVSGKPPIQFQRMRVEYVPEE